MVHRSDRHRKPGSPARTAGFFSLALLALAISACGFRPAGLPTETQAAPTSSAQAASPAAGDAASGEQLYFRSVDPQGNVIHYIGGPAFGGMMMGTYLTCASCHGPEAQGGNHIMMGMQPMNAPGITYPALRAMAQKNTGKSSYTSGDFRKAVIQGIDVDGSSLSTEMPRWQMSDQDLTDLFAFLKTLH